MDWLTNRQLIIEELDRPNDTELVDRAMVEALQYNQKHHLYFNEGRWSLLTIADEYIYDLPSNVLYTVGDVYLTYSGSPDTRRRLVNRTTDWVEQHRSLATDHDLWGDWTTGMAAGLPSFYAMRNRQIYIGPIPAESDHVIDGRCVIDYGIPLVQYTRDKSWRVLDPVSLEPISSSWTTPWLNEGGALVRARAKQYLCTRYYDDVAGAAAAQNDYIEALQHLRTESTRRRRPTALIGYLV